jgi:elongation factor Ts
MEISAHLVRDLREKTGAGMMDCKKALVESEGDIEKAIDFLRKSGIAKAEKKSGRAVKDGKVIALVENGRGAILEVLCETDFVATNEKFLAYIQATVGRVLSMDADGDVSQKVQESEKENLVSMIATIGENMQIRRVARWKTPGRIDSYLHMGGRIGVMIDVEGEGQENDALLHDICMHIAAFRPQYASPSEIPADIIAKEKEIASAQVAGKPANIVDKIVQGKVEKWYSEVCLTRQPWMRDDKTCLEKLCPKLKVRRFVRWEIGEEV